MTLNLLDALANDAVQQQRRRNKWALAAWIGFLALILAGCFLTPVMMEFSGPDEPLALLIFTSFGMLAAIPLLLAMFLTLPALTMAARIVGAITGLALAVISIAMGIGYSMQFSGQFSIAQWDLLAVVPPWIIGLSLPLALMRVLLGWQIHVPIFDPPSESPKISILGIMIGTAIAAGSVLGLSQAEQPDLNRIGFVGAAVAFGISSVLLPVILLIMRSKHYVVWWTAFLLLVLVIVPVASYAASANVWQMACFTLAITNWFLISSLPLVIVRLSGGRLYSTADYIPGALTTEPELETATQNSTSALESAR